MNIFKNIKNVQALKIFSVLVLILATQIFSELLLVPNDMYYIIPWLDIPMHIWGGFLFGLLFIFYTDYKNRGKLFYKYNILHIFASVFIIGIAWELYEYINDVVNYRDWRGILDTVKDLFDDILGSFLAYIFFKSR